MHTKVSALAKITMPLISAALMAGCVIETDPEDTLYQAAENEVVIYYKRDDHYSDTTSQSSSSNSNVDESVYDGWGLHLWNGEGCTSTDLEGMGVPSTGTDWANPYPYTGINETYGAYYVLKVDLDAVDPYRCMNFILHKGNEKAFGSANLKVELDKLTDIRSLFGFHGSSKLYTEPMEERPISVDGQQAHWLDADTIAWEMASTASRVELRYDLNGQIQIDSSTREVTGGTVVELSSGTMTEELKTRFPHLSGLAALNIESTNKAEILKSQMVVIAYNASGSMIGATEVQRAGALDSIYVDESTGNAISEELGVIVSGGDASFKLWAPTAQEVTLYLYEENKDIVADGVIAMTENTVTGVWSADASGVLGQYYRYEVKVYHPTTGKVETTMVTDPYSLSLSTNSLYSQVVDLNDDALKPANWDTSDSPDFEGLDENHILYESHLRDFSFSDSSGTPAYNGKYLALTEPSRESVSHLQELKDSGLTTLHILPAFDIATVDEENYVDINNTVGELCELKSDVSVCETASHGATIESVLESYDPSSKDAQALMNDLRMLDSFNWGYDPFHYTVPEGSYATNAEGTTRILEFREMVKATHDMGLKLIMDVVYNHTNASGTNDKSVLDKIVPGYYHRLNALTGDVEMSTCCDNTATENRMMGKLMVDSLKVWSEHYKVDGYRFDLMGHQPKELMVEALAEVRAIDPDTLFYGEGWDFGEVSNNARFTQSTQINMAGTEIGTFSDRLRDAVRGGSPFDGATSGLRGNQGFGNAAYLNEQNDGGAESVANALHNQDLIRLGMAGNLDSFVLLDYEGNTKKGKDVDYNGAPAGYTKDPSENISYVSKHDNQTLWDINAYKIATGTSPDERARMQTVGLSTVMLGQGIPFIHMGSELLRSKSMQRDSYDSGDWFNRVRFDGSDNNWNVGLPREDKDGSNYDLIQQIIADSSAAPDATDIELSKNQFMDLLKIRSGSDLFRLRTAEEVKARVDFRNVGESQTPGLIVMTIDDGVSTGADIDSDYDSIVVMINASAVEQSFIIHGATNFELHSVQQASLDVIVQNASFDETSASFTVPALTTAVFVQPQGNSGQGAGLPVSTEGKDLGSIPPYGDSVVYVKGGMNGWSDDVNWAMTFTGNGSYEVIGYLDTNVEFKFADSGWSNPNVGCDGSTVVDSGSLDLGTGGNCSLTVSESGEYLFKLNATDVATPIVSVTKVAN